MPHSGWNSPVSWAVAVMVVFAAVFEPVRQVLLHEQSTLVVGGVGGVGGLANLGAPTDDCAGQYHGKYCYLPGDVGPFAWLAVATLVGWVGPLWLAFLWMAVRCPKRTMAASEGVNADDGSSSVDANVAAPSPSPPPPAWPLPVWIGLNVLWFVFPWLSFALALHEIEGTLARQVLALALGASHPLSWNLALVVVPTAGPLTELLVGEDGALWDEASVKASWFPVHRLLGCTTAFWGMVHGVGELVYVLSTRERLRNSLLRIRTDGEVLLYWAGLLSLLLLGMQSATAYFRRRWNKQALSFRSFHRCTAGALLLVASAHWWPFGLLFLPAAAVHGVSLARSHAPERLQGIPRAHRHRLVALQLALALGVSLAGVTGVWTLRQAYMVQSTANLYVPFVFPPLCVGLSAAASYLVARGMARVAIGWCWCCAEESPRELAEPSLVDVEDSSHLHRPETELLLSSGGGHAQSLRRSRY